MEKIGFSEVGRWLLFIMCPCQADTAAGRKQETISVKHPDSGGMERWMEGWMERRCFALLSLCACVCVCVVLRACEDAKMMEETQLMETR